MEVPVTILWVLAVRINQRRHDLAVRPHVHAALAFAFHDHIVERAHHRNLFAVARRGEAANVSLFIDDLLRAPSAEVELVNLAHLPDPVAVLDLQLGSELCELVLVGVFLSLLK